MGAGASTLQTELEEATSEQIKEAIAGLNTSEQEKLKAALTVATGQPTIPVIDFEALFAHQGPYDEAAFGPAPDYTKPDAWYWYGDDGTDGPELLPDGVDKTPIAERAADCFYVHPSSYYGSGWNMNLANTDFNSITDYYIATEASAFNGSCRVYCPKFRQAQLAGITLFGEEEGRNGIADFAYADVKAAFEHYLKDRNEGRPLVLVAHSQGSIYLTRLLQDCVEGKPLLKQVVAIYCIAAWVPLSMFEGENAVFKDIKVAKAADSLGCFISFTLECPATVAAHAEAKAAPTKETRWYPSCGHKCGDPDAEPDWRLPDAGPIVCTNPLTWSSNGMGGSSEPEAWQGMLKMFPNHITWKGGPVEDADTLIALMMAPKTGMKVNTLGKLNPAEVQGLLDTESLGMFNVNEDEKTGDLQVNLFPAHLAGSNTESYEWLNFVLFWFNIRANVSTRVKAYTATCG